VRQVLVILASLAVLTGLAGCGATASTSPDAEDTLLLDFQPNAVHAGIYLAVERGYDEAEGVDLTVQRPGASTDALKLLQSGRADAAVLDIHDLGLARERGADLVGVMALVQRPLAAVIARPGITSPAQLRGRRAGVTGLPSDDAVLRAVAPGARPVTIGFEAVKALLTGRVDAVTAFWNVEGVALQRRRPGVREFRVDDFGAPAYPELVLAVTRNTLSDRRPEVEAIVRALQRGYSEAQADPESAVQAMVAREDGLDQAALAAQLDAVAPAFTAGVPAFGLLERQRLRAWAAWDRRNGILKKPLDVDLAFDTSLVRPTSRD
jgi:putative hydroxymethylpyrimidine transport system substrate-binding protein